MDTHSLQAHLSNRLATVQQARQHWTIRDCRNKSWYGESRFIRLQQSPQSPDFNRTEHLLDVQEQEMGTTDVQVVQQLDDAIMSVLTK